MTATLPATVTDTQTLVRPALQNAVRTLDPTLQEVVGYHLGWRDQHGRPTKHGGKSVRPTLTLLAAQAVHAHTATAIPGAVAVELVHNFSLLHDDVMDGGTERRNRPTVWSLYGVPTAILAGDALLTLAVEVLTRERRPDVVSCLTSAVQRLIEGQTADMAFERRLDVTVDDYLGMIGGKTAALLECAAKLGALLGGADRETVDRLGAFGRDVGLAFQLVDDLLGVLGDPMVTGKPALADLQARKKSAPVVVALETSGGPGDRLRELYARDQAPSLLDAQAMLGLIKQTGAISWTRLQARRYLASALEQLGEVSMSLPVRDALTGLARFVVERDR